jgi:hypothetical protein
LQCSRKKQSKASNSYYATAENTTTNTRINTTAPALAVLF